MLGYALRCASREDAADAVAETFLVAWRRFENVPEGESARPWLYGTARRVLANQERAKRRRDRLAERIRSDVALETDAGESETSVDAAAAAFSRLRGDERELLALVAWEGLDAGGVAQVFGCSRNAARIRIHRARRRFARELVRVDAAVKQNPVAGHISQACE